MASAATWDRWRRLVRVVNRIEGWQLRWLGTSAIALVRRRNVLLLETTGRRTGRRRRSPVTYLVDGDGAFVIGGGAGGMTRVDWVANLRQQRTAAVWVRRRLISVAVEELAGARRDEAHARARSRWPEVDRYENVSSRRIPYFRLTARDG